jgi:SAM-dependent methyltransferase
MDCSTFQALLSPIGQSAIDEAAALQPREIDFLSHFNLLSRNLPPDLARAALEIAILRDEAAVKFPSAGRMYFTRPAFEQASSLAISTYRAERYRSFTRLADLGCSIGGDTLALAQIAPTVGVDLDALRLAMARANLHALGVDRQADFFQADLEDALPLRPDPGVGLFFDPARRSASRRAFSVQDYHPPLRIVLNWLRHFPALGVKISPGVDLDEISHYDAEIEFISLRGELKEAVLWFGPLKSARRRAALLPGPNIMESQADYGAQTPLPRERRLPILEPQAYLYEPDPAILRAGLVEELGLQIDAAQLDADIAYLTTEKKVETPFARAWMIEAWFPFQLKRLRQELRARHIGRVTIKKRGSPLQPEELIRQLKLSGDEARVVFLTHLRGKPIVILAVESWTAKD